MQDLNLFIIFARVVEAGSFAEAARRMDISRAAVSKAVAKLEKDLSTRLLLRSTRHLSLTETGIALSEHVARILAEAEHAIEWAYQSDYNDQNNSQRSKIVY